MPLGLRLRDASGNVIFDTSTRTGQILGTVSITSTNQSGSLTDGGLANGTPFFMLNGGPSEVDPAVSFSGTTMSWAKNTAYPHNWAGTIIYGYY